MRSQLSREQLYRSLFLKLDRPRQAAGANRRQSVKKKGYLDAKDVVKGVNANRKEIEALFGTQRTQRAIDVFNSLDAGRCGRVSWEEFFANAELAFTQHVARFKPGGGAGDGAAGGQAFTDGPLMDGEAAAPPKPPPMTRELLYRSVFDSVDTKKKGFISQKQLVKAMLNRRSSLTMVFGAGGTANAFDAFSKLDPEGEGRVDFDGFYERCESAFVPDGDGGGGAGECEHPAAAPAHGGSFVEPPAPPPMTREILYRSVFNQVDTKQKGYISQKDLVRTMRKRRSSIANVFGASGADHAVDAFAKMDTGGEGRVDWATFFNSAEEAFVKDEGARMHDAPEQNPHAPAAVAGGGKAAPAAPALPAGK